MKIVVGSWCTITFTNKLATERLMACWYMVKSKRLRGCEPCSDAATQACEGSSDYGMTPYGQADPMRQ
jgi:hypothetical protein